MTWKATWYPLFYLMKSKVLRGSSHSGSDYWDKKHELNGSWVVVTCKKNVNLIRVAIHKRQMYILHFFHVNRFALPYFAFIQPCSDFCFLFQSLPSKNILMYLFVSFYFQYMSILFPPNHTSSLPSAISFTTIGRANALGGECIVRQNELLSSFAVEGSDFFFSLESGVCVCESFFGKRKDR